jgi:hypothetical protein
LDETGTVLAGSVDDNLLLTTDPYEGFSLRFTHSLACKSFKAFSVQERVVVVK